MDDLLRWRSEFPILETSTYLVSHSMGAMPRGATDKLREYTEEWNQNSIAAWDKWVPFFEDTAGLVGRFLHAEPGTIVMHQNVSTLFNGILSCLRYDGRRNRIVYPQLTFPTLRYNIQTRAALGAKPVEIPSPDGIRHPADTFIREINDETLLVVLDHGIYRSGGLIDVAPIVEAAHARGAMVVVDAYQTVGVVPIDVRAWKADFVLGGSHKWLCGGAGAGFLYVRPDRVETMRPRITGWFSQEKPFEFTDELEYARSPRRFLGGTPGMPAIYCARAGYEVLLQVGIERIREKNIRLVERIIDGADARGLRVNTPRDAKERSGMACVDFDGAERVEPELIRRRIFLDYRPKCGLRVSAHFYTREDEIDSFFDEVDKIRKGL